MATRAETFERKIGNQRHSVLSGVAEKERSRKNFKKIPEFPRRMSRR